MSKPLSRLTAADVMTQEVTAIPRHLSLRQAAHLLSQARVSGAPVVDACGACVGVISATDFVHYAQGHCPVRHDEAHGELCSDWQMYEEENLPMDAVSSYMTSDPVTAMPTTGVTELARMMLDAHIHRVIIVDAKRCPVGVVSTTDILAAVAYGG
jgi:CBS-domain-containing membrane protein